MTRVVQLANFYGPHSGGLKTVMEELGLRYTRAGLDRILIVPGPADAEETGPAGTRITLRAPKLPGSGGYRLITARSRVLSLLAGLRPSVVEVSDKTTLVGAARWAGARRVPAVLLSHERIDAILAGRVPGRFPLSAAADRWNRRLADAFDLIVCPSQFSAAEFGRIGAANHRVVPLGVDLATFRPRVAGGGRRAAVELVSVGRLSSEKRPDLAVATLSELVRRRVDAHLTLIGDGPLMAGLARSARSLPVTLTGHIADREAVARLLAGADAVLAPCPVESFGLGILESLACGTPVIASSGGAAPELAGGGDWGRAVRPEPGLMANAVRSMLGAPRVATRTAARVRAESFPWSATVEGMLGAHRSAGLMRSPVVQDPVLGILA